MKHKGAKAADPIRDAWIAEMEGQGLPGQELYDLVQATLAKAKAGNWIKFFGWVDIFDLAKSQIKDYRWRDK